MADGDLVVANHQLEVRSFLMGNTTSYSIMDWGPILGHKSKSSFVNQASGHGQFGGNDYLRADVKVFTIGVRGTSEANKFSLIDDLGDKWVPGATIPLTYRHDGTIGKRRIYGRTLDMDVVLDPDKPTHAICLLEFEQTDPRRYDHTQQTQAYAVNDTTAITNGGNIETADVEITFAAASTGAKLLHNGNSGFLDFDGITISGTSYVVNVRDRTVKQSTTNKRYGDLLSTSEIALFELAAGSNSLTYTTDSGSGGCTVAWRNAYA